MIWDWFNMSYCPSVDDYLIIDTVSLPSASVVCCQPLHSGKFWKFPWSTLESTLLKKTEQKSAWGSAITCDHFKKFKIQVSCFWYLTWHDSSNLKNEKYFIHVWAVITCYLNNFKNFLVSKTTPSIFIQFYHEKCDNLRI